MDKLIDMVRTPIFCAVFLTGACALTATHTGCTRAQILNAADLLADKITCAIANQDLPDKLIVEKCAVLPGDIEKVLAIVGESRRGAERAVARERIAAAARVSAAVEADAADAGVKDSGK